MKNPLIVLCFSLAFVLNANAQQPNRAIPEFNEALQYDFGEIAEGDSAVKEFVFVNKGNKALLITETNITCSCTNSEYPKEAIAPGDSGVIKVVFDTKGKSGFYEQGVNLYYDEGEINMIIYATVVPRREE